MARGDRLVVLLARRAALVDHAVDHAPRDLHAEPSAPPRDPAAGRCTSPRSRVPVVLTNVCATSIDAITPATRASTSIADQRQQPARGLQRAEPGVGVAAEAAPPPRHSSAPSAVRSWFLSSSMCASRRHRASSATSGAAAARIARTSAGDSAMRRRTSRATATTPGASSTRSSTGAGAREGGRRDRAAARGAGGDGGGAARGARTVARRLALPELGAAPSRVAAGSCDAGHPRERHVVERRPQRLDLGEAAAHRLQPLDRDDLREVARGRTAPSGRASPPADRAARSSRSSGPSARPGPRGPGRSSAPAARRSARPPRPRAPTGSTIRPRALCDTVI